jgi:hypothetical protein
MNSPISPPSFPNPNNTQNTTDTQIPASGAKSLSNAHTLEIALGVLFIAAIPIILFLIKGIKGLLSRRRNIDENSHPREPDSPDPPPPKASMDTPPLAVLASPNSREEGVDEINPVEIKPVILGARIPPRVVMSPDSPDDSDMTFRYSIYNLESEETINPVSPTIFDQVEAYRNKAPVKFTTDPIVVYQMEEFDPFKSVDSILVDPCREETDLSESIGSSKYVTAESQFADDGSVDSISSGRRSSVNSRDTIRQEGVLLVSGRGMV